MTGLAIGGGTKPLHDLISNLQAAKEDKKDPKEMKEVEPRRATDRSPID